MLLENQTKKRRWIVRSYSAGMTKGSAPTLALPRFTRRGYPWCGESFSDSAVTVTWSVTFIWSAARHPLLQFPPPLQRGGGQGRGRITANTLPATVTELAPVKPLRSLLCPLHSFLWGELAGHCFRKHIDHHEVRQRGCCGLPKLARVRA